MCLRCIKGRMEKIAKRVATNRTLRKNAAVSFQSILKTILFFLLVPCSNNSGHSHPAVLNPEGYSALGPRRPTRLELIPVSVTWSNWEYCYSPLDGILVHRRVTPQLHVPVPIQYTPGWKETMWGKVSRRRETTRWQGLDVDWASSHRPSDLKSNVLTTTPSRSHSPHSPHSQSRRDQEN